MENLKQSSLLTLLQNLAGAIISVWFIWYLWTNRALFSQAQDLELQNIVLVALLVLCTWAASSAQSYVLFRASSSSIGFFECLILTLASIFGNYLPMRAGTVVRAHYMRSIHGIGYVTFASIFSIRLILTMISAGAVGLLAVLAIVLAGNPASSELIVIFSGFILGPCLLYFLFPRNSQKPRSGFIWKVAIRFVEGFENLKRQPKVALICLVLICLQYFLLGARFLTAAHLLGQAVELSAILVMVSVSTITSFVAITPGGIGVRESVMGYATFTTGTNFSLGLMVGSIDRVILLAMVAVLGGASFLYIWFRLGSSRQTAG